MTNLLTLLRITITNVTICDDYLMNCIYTERHCFIKRLHSSVIFNDPNDVVYLYRLAMETPLLYAKFALKENGLQNYVDAMNWFNY